MGGLLSGASYPLRALRVLGRTPGLWPYLVVPVAVNVGVGLLVYAALLFSGLRAVDAFVVGLPSWAAGLGMLLRALLVIGLLLLVGFVLARFGVVLGSPWYSALSARLETLRTGMAPPEGARGLGGALRDVGRSARFEALKLLLVVSVSLLLLALNIVPGLGTLAAGVGWLALGATVACLDFFDAPLERRRLRFRQKLEVVRRSLPASAGFGLVCFVLSGVPLLNLLAIPLCVAAGTLFFCDRLAPIVANIAPEAGGPTDTAETGGKDGRVRHAR